MNVQLGLTMIYLESLENKSKSIDMIAVRIFASMTDIRHAVLSCYVKIVVKY